MLIYSIGVSVDGFINDRDGDFQWAPPDQELFDFHTQEVGKLGAYLLGRRLYEDKRVWETDPAMRDSRPEFADIWAELPKVVFSRTLEAVEGNARLAESSVEEETRAVLSATDADVQIGGADLAGQAFELGLLDELRIFRYPVVVGGGTPHLPAITTRIPLDLLETREFPSRVVYERYVRSGAGRSSG